MRAAPLLAVLALLLPSACGDNEIADPFLNLPVEGDVTGAGITGALHVARDRFGVVHIRAEHTADAGFAQGYIMAHDRLPQMDILRRYGSGKLSELFGSLDPSIIDTDLEMRVHRMTPLAQQTWDMLSASSDKTDQAVVALLQRFADGVNAYNADLLAGKWQLDPDVAASFDPARFTAWSPIDSLVLGRFQAFALSWSTPFELDATEMLQDIQTEYTNAPSTDAVRYARKDIAADLLKFAPVGDVPTIDGFPNVTADSGTRSDGSADPLHGAKTTPASGPRLPASGPKRPEIPQRLFAAAKSFFHKDRGVHDGPNGALGPHAFMRPYAGSNNWAVGPSLANGQALLATDQHLQLPNPSIFYPMHLTISDENIDVLGVTFPGIPGVILGTNGHVAWAATVSEHDVNDVYAETITPCSAGGGDCVVFEGNQVPLQEDTEQFDIGALGTILAHQTATYELVPHHGPIIPEIDGATHTLVPRTGATALSVAYTGYEPTFEIRALWNLAHAGTVDEGFTALADFTYGSQNWTMIDTATNIGWTTNAKVPLRDPRAYTFDVKTNPGGLAPFLVLPGDGTAEWQGRMDTRYVPHAVNPAQGYLATANADPVGATFDDNPLNQPMVDGRPLYAGVTYAAGVREERIAHLITAGGTSHTLDTMATIQHDTHSNVGERFLGGVLAALYYVDGSLGGVTPPPPPTGDVTTYLASLGADDMRRLTTAAQLMHGWTRETPTAVDLDTSDGDRIDSAATALFNAWMHFFVEQSIGDEFTAMNFDVWRLDDNQVVRIVYALLAHPETFAQSPTTHQPIVCDHMATVATDDSCTKVVLESMVLAMTYLESSAAFATEDVHAWSWGKLHTLTITPLFPNPMLNIPSTGQGFPKAGDNFVINRADDGWADLDFSQQADGPAQRFLATTTPGADGNTTIAVQWALPGGTIYDKSSAHYSDLLSAYYIPNKHFDAPFTLAQIVDAGESSWTFH